MVVTAAAAVFDFVGLGMVEMEELATCLRCECTIVV